MHNQDTRLCPYCGEEFMYTDDASCGSEACEVEQFEHEKEVERERYYQQQEFDRFLDEFHQEW